VRISVGSPAVSASFWRGRETARSIARVAHLDAGRARQVEQPVAAEHAARVIDEGREQAELGTRQCHHNQLRRMALAREAIESPALEAQSRGRLAAAGRATHRAARGPRATQHRV
jgi:hypothetical protein